MLRLITFGGLRVENGVVVDGAASPRSRLALLAVIAVSGARGVRREKLTAMFWPDSDDERARNALRQALFVLRRDLGGVQLTKGVSDLRLDPHVMTSDVGDFDQAVTEGRWEDAVAWYRGSFLDGVVLRDAPEFERWADEQRQRLGNAYERALESLALAAEGRGEKEAAVLWWERRVTLDPLSTRVALAYMKALTNAGERERAIQHAGVHAAATRSQLETEPDPAVAALAESLRRNATGQGAITGVAPSGASDAGPPRKVATTSLPASDRAAEVAPRSMDVAEHSVVGVPRVPPAAARRWLSRHGVIAAGVTLLALSGIAYARPWAVMAPGVSSLDARRVVVADFENLTGDTTFNRLGAALADWVTHGVMLTGIARVVDPASLVAVRRLNPELDTLSGRERVAAMARAAAAGTVVSGAIYREGDGLVIRARITDLVNARVLSTLDPITTPTNDPLQPADLLREKVAGALASAFDARIASITLPSSRPPTFAAYREYIVGLEQFALSERQSLPYMERASQLDTTFGLPLIWAAFAHSNAGNARARDSVVAILESRRRYLGPLEELQLQALQARDPDEKLLLYERGARLSPGSTWSHNAAIQLHDRNRMREAIRHFEMVDPEHGWARGWRGYWLYYSRALHMAGEYEKELRTARRAASLVQSPSVGVFEVRALMSVGDMNAARRRVDELVSSAAVGCVPFGYLLSLVQEFQVHGHRSDADSVAARWIKLCSDEGARRPAPPAPADSFQARLRMSLGLALYLHGEFDESELALREAARLSEIVSGEVHEYLARIAARRGDGAAAERALAASHRGPSRVKAVEARAAVEALLGHSERAIELLITSRQRLSYEWLHRDPDYDSLRDDPRFISLVTPR